MRLRFALITDYANVTNDGKLNLIGVTDRIHAYHFPAVHRELFVINSLETDNDDEGKTHEIQVHVINPDGRKIAEIGGQLAIEGGGKQVLNQVHCFRDIQFLSGGAHQVNIIINGAVSAELQLELIQVEQPPA